jgi:ABC-type multidrug transport system ATPase subunit
MDGIDVNEQPLVVRDVSKTFGGGFNPARALRRNGKRAETGRRVVDRVSFEVARGEIFGVIGANGSSARCCSRTAATCTCSGLTW